MGSALGIPSADCAHGQRTQPMHDLDFDWDHLMMPSMMIWATSTMVFDDFEVTVEKWCFDEDLEACDFDHADWADVEPEKTERTLHELFEEEDDEDVFRPPCRVVFLSKYL
ncbi:MAG: hypothetical protein NZM00_06840 [Anaerolinea sp.]|nr:hypothetical protein [Anaerolinea sp.]